VCAILLADKEQHYQRDHTRQLLFLCQGYNQEQALHNDIHGLARKYNQRFRNNLWQKQIQKALKEEAPQR
jgi:phosphoribosyl-AMP cyclohydrolase